MRSSDMSIAEEQRLLCERFSAEFVPSPHNVKSGFAVGTEGKRPIHGLRHPPTADTTGWYIWCGDYSDSATFFKPVHTEHLSDYVPETLRLLGLAPGYRFLIADGHEDVWYDRTLLII